MLTAAYVFFLAPNALIQDVAEKAEPTRVPGVPNCKLLVSTTIFFRFFFVQFVYFFALQLEPHRCSLAAVATYGSPDHCHGHLLTTSSTLSFDNRHLAELVLLAEDLAMLPAASPTSLVRRAALLALSSAHRPPHLHHLPAFSHRLLSSADPKPATSSSDPAEKPHFPNASDPSQAAPPSDADANSDSSNPEKPGAIGGFMRGLIGGQAVAVEDAFVAEAKQQGVDLPPPPPQRHATLVPVRRRKRRDDGDDDAEGGESIRDRIFGRFAGSAFMQGAFNAKERIKETIDESNNPLVNMMRNIYDRIFAENEMGMVIREIREEDPDFRISEFLSEVESVLVPTILGAYLEGHREALESYCTEEAFAMLNASIRERDTEGIIMDTNILDIGDVELTAGRLLEDSPVLIVTFKTQQINCLRDSSGKVVEGKEDDIRAVYYAWAFVREAEFEEARPSGGGMGASEGGRGDVDDKPQSDGGDEADTSKKPWKLMEMVIRGAHSTI